MLRSRRSSTAFRSGTPIVGLRTEIFRRQKCGLLTSNSVARNILSNVAISIGCRNVFTTTWILRLLTNLLKSQDATFTAGEIKAKSKLASIRGKLPQDESNHWLIHRVTDRLSRSVSIASPKMAHYWHMR